MSKLGLYITKDSHQSGELQIEGDVRIEGSFSGTLISDGNLYLGKNSSFEGEAHVVNAQIEGSFSGALESKGQTSFTSSAKFNGILDTQLADIAVGTELIGEVRICQR